MAMRIEFLLSSLLWASSAHALETNFTADSAAQYLNLVPPVAVEMAGWYADGGSIGFSLVDANKKHFHMFEDHSMVNDFVGRTNIPENIRSQFTNVINTVGRIYISDIKPTRGGRLTSVEEGRMIKSAVLCLAQDWCRREYPSGVGKTPPKREDEETIDYVLRYRRDRAASYILQHFHPPDMDVQAAGDDRLEGKAETER
jgi:hypothetical protein